MHLKRILYHYRPINLFIVCATQLVVLFFLIKNIQPTNEFRSIANCFPTIVFPAIITCTIIITIAGYLINDFFDYEIDKLNKPNILQLGKLALLKLYFFNVAIGLFIAIYLAQEMGNLLYVLVYLLATALLFLYGSHLKKLGLIGNLVVSLFSSFVIAIIWFAFTFFYESSQNESAQSLLILFMSFVFLSSMAREIIKDCQDIKGDSKYGLKTLPIRIGIIKTTFFVNFFLATLVVIIAYWIYSTYSIIAIYKSTILVIILFFISYSILKTSKAKITEDFKAISKIIKICMAFGILYLFTLTLPL